MSKNSKLKYADLSDEEAVEFMRRKIMEMKKLLIEIKDLLKAAVGDT